MKIKSTKTHTVTFSIQCFEATEGGMHHNTFGDEYGDIGAAIEALSLANIQDKNTDWIIVCDVKTDINSNEVLK